MKYLAWLCLMITAQSSFAQQKQTTHIQQVWLGYVNQTRFSDKWGGWLDLHLRTLDEFTNDLSTGIARVGITYYASEKIKLTAGYAFVNFFPADDHSGISQPEHRPWQQMMWTNAGKRSRLLNAIRIEERFRRKIKDADELADGYNFNYRVRYNTMLTLPLSRNAFAPGTLSFSLNDEVHLNFGKQVVFNYFDQNRLLIGFAYHVNSSDYLQFGYMNLFQQLSAGNKYRMIHAGRVYFYHNIDLRKNRNSNSKN